MDNYMVFSPSDFARKKTDAERAQKTPPKGPQGPSTKTDPVKKLESEINDNNNQDTAKMYDDLNKLKREKKISKDNFDTLRNSLNRKASSILGSDQLIESGNLYTFKEDLGSNNIQIGDQVRVQKIDGVNKTIQVKKIGRGNFKPFNISSEEFNDKIQFDTTPKPDPASGSMRS